ncbi:MAG: hypothetical protein FJ390_08435 [Verrucomicrobia bacterium]|nr:hypothetical protein [Verrucomicrobiota bacterium]
MDSIPDSNFTPTGQTLSEPSSAETTKESNPSPKELPSPKGILEGQSEYHTITSTTSEIGSLKKSLSWNNSVVEGSHNPPEKVSLPTVSSWNSTRADEEIISHSLIIKKWASDIAVQKTSELQDATDALAYVTKNPTALPLEKKQQLEECHTAIRNQATKAKKYADWTSYRTELLKGNTRFQTALEESGQAIDKDWTLQELNEDWELTKEEPWAQEDPQYDELKAIITPLAAQYRQTQQEMAKAKETMLSFAQDVKNSEQKALQQKNARTEAATQVAKNTARQPSQYYYQTENNRHRYERDDVFVPGVGNVDRNLKDIGNVEHHDDGTVTITDMSGRRYDYPGPKPSSDSCTIS